MFLPAMSKAAAYIRRCPTALLQFRWLSVTSCISIVVACGGCSADGGWSTGGGRCFCRAWCSARISMSLGNQMAWMPRSIMRRLNVITYTRKMDSQNVGLPKRYIITPYCAGSCVPNASYSCSQAR